MISPQRRWPRYSLMRLEKYRRGGKNLPDTDLEKRKTNSNSHFMKEYVLETGGRYALTPTMCWSSGSGPVGMTACCGGAQCYDPLRVAGDGGHGALRACGRGKVCASTESRRASFPNIISTNITDRVRCLRQKQVSSLDASATWPMSPGTSIA